MVHHRAALTDMKRKTRSHQAASQCSDGATPPVNQSKKKQKRKKRSKSTMAASRIIVTAKTTSATAAPVLLDLGRELVEATFVRRPSARNRSPYVADVRLADGRVAIAHTPSLDMGGKMRKPGTRMLLRPARDRKGNLVGANTLGKYGTPKCEFIAQLLRCAEPENADRNGGTGVWVGCHPRLGENIAAALTLFPQTTTRSP